MKGRGGIKMEMMALDFNSTRQPDTESAVIQTTLFDLIEAISEEVQPGEDRLIANTVVHILESCKARFLSQN